MASVGDRAFPGAKADKYNHSQQCYRYRQLGPFGLCKGLTNLTIPQGVKRISDYAFPGAQVKEYAAESLEEMGAGVLQLYNEEYFRS